jgi:hypothetical protein
MCKNMIRTGIFNLTSMDIDILWDTPKGYSRASLLMCISSLRVCASLPNMNPVVKEKASERKLLKNMNRSFVSKEK